MSKDINKLKIGFIGAGKLATAMIEGLLKSQAIKPENIGASRRNQEALHQLASQYGIKTSTSNKEIAQWANVIVLGVKPFQVESVLKDLANELQDRVIVSLAVGISATEIAKLALQNNAYVAMCNTALAVCESVTCLNGAVEAPQTDRLLKELFDLVGTTLFVTEQEVDAACTLASCGTAYALKFISASSRAGVSIGLKANESSKLMAQCMKGAAELILQNEAHPEAEIDKVCTPGGTTIAGLRKLEEHNFTHAIIECFNSAFNRLKGN